MRRIILALVGAAALIAPAATVHAQAPLGSIFRCDKPDNHQGSGAVIGGLLGGVIGNGIAGDDRRDRIAGTVLGAGVGAAVGSSVGCNMASGDQTRAEDATRTALAENRSTTWMNDRTGVSGRIDIINTFQRGDVAGRVPVEGPPRSLNDVRFADGVRYPADYDLLQSRYRANMRVDLRAAPSSDAAVLGELRDGERFDALARVNSEWLLAGRDGMAVGYVSERRADYDGHADMLAYNDRHDEVPVADEQTCRTFDQMLMRPNGRDTTQRFTACQSLAGDWLLQS